MAEQERYPFESLSFMMIEGNRPRVSLRMARQDDGMYELQAEKGSAANPSKRFARQVPVDVAQRLKDALQGLGVFGWDESYGNAPEALARRWSLNIVFKKGVFEQSSKGGSAVPAEFDLMLEELYRLDMPRPAERAGGAGSGAASGVVGGSGDTRGTDASASPFDLGAGAGLGADAQGASGLSKGLAGLAGAMGTLGLGSVGGMSAGDLGAYGAVGKTPDSLDFSKLGAFMSSEEAGDAAKLLEEAQRNPQAFQQRMKDEFKHLPPDEQNRMLDALASTGLASRAWWERYLRG